MAVTEYIGPLVGITPANPMEWTSTRPYEALNLVSHQGDSYMAMQDVPAGIDISNESYWWKSASFSAQIEQYYRNLMQILPYDPKPQPDSTKGVTSSGIYNAIYTKENVLKYGADNTGTKPTGSAIQSAIDANKGGCIYIPNGTYLIETTILNYSDYDDYCDIICAPDVTFKPVAQMKYVFAIGLTTTETDSKFNNNLGDKKFFVGGKVYDPNNYVTNCAIYVNNIHAFTMLYTAIRCKVGAVCNDENSRDSIFTGINAMSSGGSNNSIGLNMKGPDSQVFNSTVYYYHTNVKTLSGNAFFNTVHTLSSPNDSNDISFDIYANTVLSNCYFDSERTSINVNTDFISVFINNCVFYSYKSHTPVTVINLNNHLSYIYINGLHVQPKAENNANIALANYGKVKTYLKNYTNIQIEQAQTFPVTDPLLQSMHPTVYGNTKIYLTSDEWMYIGSFTQQNDTAQMLSIFLNGRVYNIPFTIYDSTIDIGTGKVIGCDDDAKIKLAFKHHEEDPKYFDVYIQGDPNRRRFFYSAELQSKTGNLYSLSTTASTTTKELPADSTVYTITGGTITLDQ